jgi:hypothetical protein
MLWPPDQGRFAKQIRGGPDLFALGGVVGVPRLDS